MSKEVKLLILGPIALISTLFLFAGTKLLEAYTGLNIFSQSILGAIIRIPFIIGFAIGLVGTPILSLIAIIMLFTKRKPQKS